MDNIHVLTYYYKCLLNFVYGPTILVMLYMVHIELIHHTLGAMLIIRSFICTLRTLVITHQVINYFEYQCSLSDSRQINKIMPCKI